jgi:predicted  nucleic acid-binding Zn-ribbon protein
MELKKFSALEKRIGVLVEDHTKLKKNYQELEEILENRESALVEANKRIEDLKRERDTIRSKVDSMLELLQDIQVPH